MYVSIDTYSGHLSPCHIHCNVRHFWANSWEFNQLFHCGWNVTIVLLSTNFCCVFYVVSLFLQIISNKMTNTLKAVLRPRGAYFLSRPFYLGGGGVLELLSSTDWRYLMACQCQHLKLLFLWHEVIGSIANPPRWDPSPSQVTHPSPSPSPSPHPPHRHYKCMQPHASSGRTKSYSDASFQHAAPFGQALRSLTPCDGLKTNT